MDSTERLTLGKSLNKSSKNENMALNAVLSGKNKLLPEDGIESAVDLYEEYVRERKNSNKFRLIININPFCTNVLFNPFTEIVKYDDDNNVTVLNYAVDGLKDIDGVIGKDGTFSWTAYDAIRDTQLSNDKCGFTYYCGIDIFNNHILRNKNFKSINYSKLSEKEWKSYEDVYGTIGYKDRLIQQGESSPACKYLIPEDFNTIDDYMRDRNGVIVSDYKMNPVYKNVSRGRFVLPYAYEVRMPLHLYQNYDVYSFEDCVSQKLVENNGWFGFSNPSLINSLTYNNSDSSTDSDSSTSSKKFSVEPDKIDVCDDETSEVTLKIDLGEVDNGPQTGKTLNINKTINNRKYCDFIDMYPSRELYSFTPLYNERKKRYEKNWNYCLTYPSRNITERFGNNGIFSFFKKLSDGTISLKAVAFDDFTVGDDGRNLLTVYSVCAHGLREGDRVNIYKNNDLFYNNGTVANIVDKYVFQVYKDSANMSDKWINIDEIEWDNEKNAVIDGVTYHNGTTTVVSNGSIYLVLPSKRCNIDPKAQDISFKRVLSNVECDYYVRVFSRLPNFKFANAEINDYNLYQDKELGLIDKYSNPTSSLSNFENHIADTSFAETSYGDADTEIVFTDDVDISYLKDNLGRPLSDIYLTIVKNNKGYKEWYSKEHQGNYTFNDDNIEFSHCFGYNSSSFLFNDFYRIKAGFSDINDVRDICSINKRGLEYSTGTTNDDIVFDEVKDYYGDICCYCPVECNEYSLQSVMGRFNTVQREMVGYKNRPEEYFLEAFRSFYDEGTEPGTMYHDEIIDDESGSMASKPGYIVGMDNLWYAFNVWHKTPYAGYPPYALDLYHSSFHIRPDNPVIKRDDYKIHGMTSLNEGYFYKMHYKIPLKTVSMSISKDNGITYDIFSIETSGENLLIKTTYENDLVLNDKLTLYSKSKNKFYYLTVTNITTKYYFECSVKNEDLSEGFKDGGFDSTDDVSLIKRSIYTPEYAKLIKDGSCTYYWRNIVPNGIERDDSKIYPFTNGAFYVNRQINFFLRRQDPHKENLAISEAGFNYTPDGESLPIEFNNNQYYDSEEIETC